MRIHLTFFILFLISLAACTGKKEEKEKAMEPNEKITLLTLDPGHFHAALVQKKMYEQVAKEVYLYAPEGDDYKDHMNRINGFNSRENNPTSWEVKMYTGSDFLEKMVSERAGNVVVISGNNNKKTDYIMESVKAGFNVLSDKPMVISPEKFLLLEEAFTLAAEKDLLLYDVMTERYEITTLLQKELSQNERVFGKLLGGSPENPAITKESIHHFNKLVAGNLIKRPAWFFDSSQQGDGLVDVTTHLVDLVQWECYPDIVLNKSDVEIIRAEHWPTVLTPEEFNTVTRLEGFPDYLGSSIRNGNLEAFSNGEMVYKLKDIYAKVRVEWKYKAPEGTGDTHFSVMRGSNAKISIRQGPEENYKSTLYVENTGEGSKEEFEGLLQEAIQSMKYEGLTITESGSAEWIITIPDEYRIGHEAHFGQVTEKYIDFLTGGTLPEWEVPNMIVKYYTTTLALKMARENK